MKALIIIIYIQIFFLIGISILNQDLWGITIGAFVLAIFIADYFNLFK
jgi:hypothetical protein